VQPGRQQKDPSFSMRTILHLITGLEAGGAERMLVRLATATDQARFRSVVVSMTGGGAFAPVLEAGGIELRQLGMRRGRPEPAGLWRLDRILRNVQPDLLQTWLYHADFLGLSARLLGRVPRLVWNIQCTDMRGDGLSRTGAMLRRLLSWSAAIPDAIVVNSRAGQGFHKAIGYRPRRWEFIPSGVDTREFRPDLAARASFRQELGVENDALVIGLAARFHPMKDHATFLTAAAHLATGDARVRFLLAGTRVDPSNRELTDAVAQLGVGNRVTLLGERRDMPRFFAALDIAGLSSAYGEGCPNVLGEAMACGVPCVATEVGDSAALIGETGVTVPARDPAALAAALDRLIALGPEGRRALGERARARILRDYDLDTIVAHYEALYEEIAAR
jgi:glycosyltransferase involved in cell wall biosynthesis